MKWNKISDSFNIDIAVHRIDKFVNFKYYEIKDYHSSMHIFYKMNHTVKNI